MKSLTVMSSIYREMGSNPIQVTGHFSQFYLSGAVIIQGVQKKPELYWMKLLTVGSPRRGNPSVNNYPTVNNFIQYEGVIEPPE